MPRSLSALVTGALLIPGALVAQPFQAQQPAGNWSIFFNEATGGCFMERQFDDGVVMQVGTEAAMLGTGSDLPFGFLALYAPELMDVGGEGGTVSFSFGEDMFQGEAVGVEAPAIAAAMSWPTIPGLPRISRTSRRW